MTLGALYLILKIVASLGTALIIWMKLIRWFKLRKKRNRR